EVRLALRIEQPLFDRILGDPLEGRERGVLRVRAAAHLVHDHEGAQVVEVCLAAAGGPGSANLAVHVQPRPENWRIAGAARNLPGEAARRRHAADLAFRAEAVAV